VTARPLAALSLLLVLVSACVRPPPGPGEPNDDDSALADDDDDNADVVGLTCAPENIGQVLDIWLGSSETVQLHAEAILSDGTTVPVEDGAWWSVLDRFGGIISNSGLFTTPEDRGGRATIEVQWEGLSALCSVDLRLRVQINAGLENDDDALDAIEGAAVTADDACAPEVIYPGHEAVFPPNVSAPEFQWTVASGSDMYVVELSTAYARVEVVTRGVSWEDNSPVFAYISDSHDGEPVAVDVRVLGGLWDPGSLSFFGGLCTASAPRGVGLSAVRLFGSVYYWSPAAQGLRRIRIGAASSETWWTSAETGECVGCHALNPENPQLMTMVYGGGNGWVVAADVSDPGNPVMPPSSREGNFIAPNHDGTRLVRSFNGVLYLDDITTNTNIGVVPTSAYATHVNWSPDGTRLVYASCSNSGTDWHVTGCALRTVDVAGDTFSNDASLLALGGSWNYYYPSFSPDSQWVAFNRSTGDAYDDPDAQVMLISASGGVPIELGRANGTGALSNSWPRWGPQSGDWAWLAFASRREYGRVVSGVAQVWLAEVDLTLAAQGLDPSKPAFWLPAQDITQGNHTPVWVPRSSQ
jgi:hypothetical protein